MSAPQWERYLSGTIRNLYLIAGFLLIALKMVVDDAFFDREILWISQEDSDTLALILCIILTIVLLLRI